MTVKEMAGNLGAAYTRGRLDLDVGEEAERGAVSEFRRGIQEHVRAPSGSRFAIQQAQRRGARTGSYSTLGAAARWKAQYVQSVCEAFSFDPEFLIRHELVGRFGLPNDVVQDWVSGANCAEYGRSGDYRTSTPPGALARP